MSTYPEEFSRLEAENKKLTKQRDALLSALEGVFWYAANRHQDVHIESYREAIKKAKAAIEAPEIPADIDPECEAMRADLIP